MICILVSAMKDVREIAFQLSHDYPAMFCNKGGNFQGHIKVHTNFSVARGWSAGPRETGCFSSED